ncbi:hypothetical protein GJ496_009643 [Pomphorhynchus laevis]|nr:hypothetical protein GJ496_009643 [Pomphorhynchus laevis]
MVNIETPYDAIKTVCTASVEPVAIDNEDCLAKFEAEGILADKICGRVVSFPVCTCALVSSCERNVIRGSLSEHRQASDSPENKMHKAEGRNSLLNIAMSKFKKLLTCGAAEILIRRRFCVIESIMRETGLTVQWTYVESCKNKTDSLTRGDKKRRSFNTTIPVRTTQFTPFRRGEVVCSGEISKTICSEKRNRADSAHLPIHRYCVKFSTVPENWLRLAGDITHYRRKPFLTVIKSGPSIFAIWKDY